MQNGSKQEWDRESVRPRWRRILDGQFRVDAFAGEGRPRRRSPTRADHLGVEAPVAIKCLNLPATLDTTYGKPLVDGFKDASRIHYRLARGNLHIAQTIASGSTVAPRTGAVVPYLVREWFEGESLASDLAKRREKKMTGRSVNETMALLEAAYEGVSYAHQQGEVHLSLNPSNLFLATKAEGGASLKVLDSRRRERHERHEPPQARLAGAGHVSPRPARAVSGVRGPGAARPGRGAAGPLDRRLCARAHHARGALRSRRDVRAGPRDPHTSTPSTTRRRPNPAAHGLKLPRQPPGASCSRAPFCGRPTAAPRTPPSCGGGTWKSAVRPTLSRPQVAVAAVGVGVSEPTGLGPSTLVPAAGAPAPAERCR